MPSLLSYLLASVGMLMLGAYLIIDCVIIAGLIFGSPIEEPNVRVRWVGVVAEGWVALVPGQLFALLLVLANREAAGELTRSTTFKLRYLWLWITGR